MSQRRSVMVASSKVASAPVIGYPSEVGTLGLDRPKLPRSVTACPVHETGPADSDSLIHMRRGFWLIINSGPDPLARQGNDGSYSGMTSTKGVLSGGPSA